MKMNRFNQSACPSLRCPTLAFHVISLSLASLSHPRISRDQLDLTNLTAEMINCNVPLTGVLGKLYDVSPGFVPPLFTKRKDLFLPLLF